MQNTGLNRDTIDKFYTKTDIAIKCCEQVQHLLKINYDIDVVIEPSAGNSSFVNKFIFFILILKECII